MVNADTESVKPNDFLLSTLPAMKVVSLSSSLNERLGNGIKESDVSDTVSAKSLNWDNLPGKNTNCLSNGKSFIDHIFENFDDIHALYKKNDHNSPDMETTRKRFSNLSDYTPPYNSPEKFLTEETKSGRKLATIEGRRDFCEILEHVGINSSSYLAGIFSSKKKGKLTFGSSTPIANKTLLSKSSIIATPLPLSEIRFLASPLDISTDMNGDMNSPITPVSKWIFTPDCKNLPVSENMKTLLLGITCYVDVRTEKENHSEICKSELLAIGAKVEKNFTKKVTHVIFKEGRMSTYIRAKKYGVPIVSVVWIEACKLAKGPVDPALYPPTKMEKYEEGSPFSMMMKRKLERLRKGGIFRKEKKGGSLRLTPTVRKSNKRKAVTEFKENRAPKELNNKERQCTKKLNFIDIDVPKGLDEQKDIMKLDVSVNENESLSDSSIFAQLKLHSVPKRKSAPGALAKRKKGKEKNLNDYFQKENISRKRERSKSPDNDLKDPEEFSKQLQSDYDIQNENKSKKFVPIAQTKKRKLFNPGEVHLSESLLPQNVEFSYPHPESSATVNRNKGRSNRRKEVNALSLLNDADSHAKNTMQKQHCEEIYEIPVPRNSLSLFVLNKERNSTNKVKHTPTIVFTSVPSSDCSKLTAIVKQLGTFEIEDRVSEKTTHVVTNSMRRTLNLFRGLARGCWILGIDWILKSDLASKWLAEEHFEQKTYYPAVSKSRLQRQAFKNAFVMDLFSTCGPIYVSQNSSPPTHDLIELIKLCCGKIVPCARGAKIIVGDKTTSDRSIVKVREKWILDSICNYKLLDTKNYVINQINPRKSLEQLDCDVKK